MGYCFRLAKEHPSPCACVSALSPPLSRLMFPLAPQFATPLDCTWSCVIGDWSTCSGRLARGMVFSGQLILTPSHYHHYPRISSTVGSRRPPFMLPSVRVCSPPTLKVVRNGNHFCESPEREREREREQGALRGEEVSGDSGVMR